MTPRAPLLDGSRLYHAVACRIVARYLLLTGVTDARIPNLGAGESEGTDVVGVRDGAEVKVKVKADPYCGTDPALIADRSMAFYRRQGSDYAFQAVSNAETRRPGWMFHSGARDLYYYFLALGQTEAEVAALMGEPDDVFLSEIKVERDELHIIPMDELRDWFEDRFEQYTPRPVLIGQHSAWYRLVPRDVLRQAVPIEVVGPIFAAIMRL